MEPSGRSTHQNRDSRREGSQLNEVRDQGGLDLRADAQEAEDGAAAESEEAAQHVGTDSEVRGYGLENGRQDEASSLLSYREFCPLWLEEVPSSSH
jgi:hypothetical protein